MSHQFDADDYRSIPALRSYIDRIGAEQLNFRRFMVKEHRGKYYIEKSLIKIEPDGSIVADNAQYAPTEDEADRIRAALHDVKWPEAIGAEAQTLEALERKVRDKANLFVFWDVTRTKIIMAQERVKKEDGGKYYLPWTFYDDAKWRRMEPEGLLPFWKPALSSKRDRIMVHEGAKAAAYIDALINDPLKSEEAKKHPWIDDLKFYEHWGMIGGALAPHRTDYAELRKSQPVEVVYVCDNDVAGKKVLREFSLLYGRKLKGIRFDGSWPESWDMADPLPEKMRKKGRYVGPELKDLMRPATWATEQVPNPNGGRPIYAARRQFGEEWFHSVRPEVFIHCDWPNQVLTPQEFNNKVAPFSNVDDTARLVRKDDASKSCVVKYDPSCKSGIYADGQGDFINTHCPSTIRAEEGDPSIWEEFVAHLIPDEKERTEVIRWCATLVCRPDIKMTYALLLISETQGVGKTTLGEKILAPLIGADNVSFPSEHEITESGFNYWASHKRLAIANEIYSGQSKKAYNRLKSLITDRTITVSKKFQANYEIQNWLHIIACSNSPRAIRLSEDDRRWFVPTVTEDKKDWAWWSRLNSWLVDEGGLGKIRHWLAEWLKKNDPVMPGATAPWTPAKLGIIEEGWSSGQALVANVLDLIRERMNGKDVMVLDVHLVDLIRARLWDGKHNERLEKPLTIRSLAKSKGWFVSPVNVYHRKWDAGFRKARMICSSRSMANRSATELHEEGVRPLDLDKELPL
jgi:hypothetical protein